MSILGRLWNGGLCPSSQEYYRAEDYRGLIHLYERNEKKLIAALNNTQKEDLQKMQELVEEMRNISECSAFMEGFRLAVQLMAASVDG